jgi:putative membrane protein insertion efficiency factor
LRTLCEKSLKFSMWFFVGAYRTLGTTYLGGACRFSPSCSEYALEALRVHPSHKAFWLITKRICKCRPGGPCGHDPVPPAGGLQS